MDTNNKKETKKWRNNNPEKRLKTCLMKIYLKDKGIDGENSKSVLFELSEEMVDTLREELKKVSLKLSDGV